MSTCAARRGPCPQALGALSPLGANALLFVSEALRCARGARRATEARAGALGGKRARVRTSLHLRKQGRAARREEFRTPARAAAQRMRPASAGQAAVRPARARQELFRGQAGARAAQRGRQPGAGAAHARTRAPCAYAHPLCVRSGPLATHCPRARRCFAMDRELTELMAGCRTPARRATQAPEADKQEGQRGRQQADKANQGPTARPAVRLRPTGKKGDGADNKAD